MRLGLLRGLVCAWVLACAGVEAARADPTGTWLDKEGGTVRIRTCGGGALCGTIASVKPRLDPETSRPWTDKKNVDPRLRARPLVGVQVLIAMQPNGARKWSGRLYNPNDGKSYSGNLLELGSGAIRVEGCWLGVCGGENLRRVGTVAAR
jgi:uncharacterized protein (DUF2147 family)